MVAARYLARWELDGVRGTVVVIDVLRAFTTAAYAFGAGAAEIWLVGGVEEALKLAATMPRALVMGEEGGRRPAGFDFSNSPVEVAAQDLRGRILVQRTSAGTQGVIAARQADRCFAASLVCARATALAVGTEAPAYIITGRFADGAARGEDDLVTAQFIEGLRTGSRPDPAGVARAVTESPEAERTLAVGEGHVHPDDIAYATDVDRFDFAMRVDKTSDGRQVLRAVAP